MVDLGRKSSVQKLLLKKTCFCFQLYSMLKYFTYSQDYAHLGSNKELCYAKFQFVGLF